MASGAVLADNLVLLVVFWEGLLLTLFGMIAIGRSRSAPYGTAIKAFVIVGVTDLCMMLGVMLTGSAWRAPSRCPPSGFPWTGWAALAFLLLVIGAMGKAGAMPFHSWIPDAAARRAAALHGHPARPASKSSWASTSWRASPWTCST